MRHSRWFAATWLALAAAIASAQPATQPAIQPAQLKLMRQAYGKLKSLSLAGTIHLTADIQGQQINQQSNFTASYSAGGANASAPLRFRQEVPDDVIAAGTGEKVYLYLPAHNIYSVQDTPTAQNGPGPARFDDLSDDVRGLLWTQNLSLALALSEDAAQELTARGTPSPAPDVTIDGQACPAITFAGAAQDMTVILNPKTHLLRRVLVDSSRGLRARGAEVKSALLTVDYTLTTPDADLKPDQFAFTPPATAQEQQDTEAAAMALVGKKVPHFSVAGLGGGNVSDTSLNGSVYILDFWATWCGPCVASLPNLDAIYKTNQAAGLKVFAVNQQEEADKVKEFVTAHNLSLTVLLDTDGKVGGAFGVQGIPQTVLVGRDGIVKHVFIGTSDEQEKAIADAVHDALTAQ